MSISFDSSKEKSEEEEENFTRREFQKTSFKRSFILPENINEDEISAEYKNGILQMKLPKMNNGYNISKKEIQIK